MTWLTLAKCIKVAMSWWRAWLPLLLILAVSVKFYGWAHERGVRSRDEEVSELTQAVAGHKASAEGYALTMEAQRAELEKRDEQDRQLAARANGAVEAARAKARESDKALVKALEQLSRWSREPKCKAILDADLSVCGG